MSGQCLINITEKAKDFLHKKKKLNLTIEFPEHRANCECVFIPVPEIFAKKPKSPERYKMFIIDGIDVYISHAVTLPDNVVIDIESILGIKILKLSGFKSSEL